MQLLRTCEWPQPVFNNTVRTNAPSARVKDTRKRVKTMLRGRGGVGRGGEVENGASSIEKKKKHKEIRSVRWRQTDRDRETEIERDRDRETKT